MRKLTAVLVLASVYLSIFAPFATVALGQIAGRSREKRMNDIPTGFTFRLSEGVQGSETRTVQPPATAEPITEDLSSSILKRLPAIKSDPSDQTEFAKRIGTLPAPKTGNRIPVKFPADDSSALPNTTGSKAALEVLRFSPEGEVPLAPDLSVTFSQPMVAVTSQEEAAKYAPVEFTPHVEGRWRWLGTKTLMFDTDKRFPMATKFTARIAAGTKSATGQVLAKDFSWTFTTPPPKVEQMIPQNQVVRRDALMFIRFDQAINPEAVLRTISVLAGGRKLATRLATEAEIAADGNISYHAKQTQPGRWIAFRAVNANGGVEDAMPGASTITVNVEKGTPSAEGPLTTVERQAFQFTTYGPFKYRRSFCGWESKPDCSPFDAWYVEFNNPIDSGKFAKEMVKVEPPVEGLNVYPSGNYVYFQGYKKGNTTYKVTVDGGLTDNFGQTLGQPAVATFKVGPAPQNFYPQGGSMVVLDPGSKPTFSIYTTNHSNARVRMYRVAPENWYQFTQYFRRMNYDDGERPAIPGPLISETVVPIKNVQDELVETRIDLSAALPGGLGNIILDVEPTVKRDKYDRSRVFTWVQGTHIGLDAFVDNEELVGFATDLATGKSLNGVQLSIYPNGAGGVSSVLSDDSIPTEEKGWIDTAWEWIAGTGGPSAYDIASFNPDGTQAESETIGPAAIKFHRPQWHSAPRAARNAVEQGNEPPCCKTRQRYCIPA